MSRGHGRYVAALGGLALTLASHAVHCEPSKPPEHAPSAEAYQATTQAPTPRPPEQQKPEPKATSQRCGKAGESIESADCAEIRSAESAEIQAVAARDQVNVGWLQFWGLIATITFTGWAARSAANAARSAQKAADALPILERAYVYALIREDRVYDAIEATLAEEKTPGMMPKNVRTPRADIVFKNFGKTPARLVTDEIKFSFIPPRGDVWLTTDSPIGYNYVLGSDGETAPWGIDLQRPLTAVEARALKDGELGLTLWGWITYRDIWSETQTQPIRFSYNPELKRMVDQDGGGQHRAEQRHEPLLARLLPSHWWPRRKR